MDMLHATRKSGPVPELAPLVMSPVLAEKPWGGRRLADYGKELPEDKWIGESWEVADLPAAAVTAVADPRSRVAAGAHAGKSLRQLIDEFGVDLLGSATPTDEGDFPLLVKLLDARQHLSVQVHPDEAYVAAHPEARLKTESWYVVDAVPESHLYLGLRAGTTVENVAARAGTAAVAGLLDAVPAHAGDFHHLPAGLVHALGAGVLVAEVQTPSDTTFRIYDWEDRYGRPHRQMHVTDALEAIRPGLRSQHQAAASDLGSRVLVACPAYWIREHRGSSTVPIDNVPETRVLLVAAGAIAVDGHELGPGRTVILPACEVMSTAVVSAPESVVLEIGLGSGD